MVKYVIEDEDEPKILRLAIKLMEDGAARLMASEIGEGQWFVATLTTDGKMRLHSNVPDSLGLSLDEKGRIQLDEGD